MGTVLFTADRDSLVNNFYEGILTFEGDLQKLSIVMWVTYDRKGVILEEKSGNFHCTHYTTI